MRKDKIAYRKEASIYFLGLFYIIICLICVCSNRIALASNDGDFSISSMMTPRIEYINPINIQISAKGINHISLTPLIVTNITGDAADYSASVSENGSEIFLTSKLEVGKNIPIAVTVAGGRVIDLNLMVVDAQLPSIAKIDLAKTDSPNETIRAEITEMIDAMRLGVVGKYYVTENFKKVTKRNIQNIRIGNLFLAISELNTYRFGDLTGIELDIKNKGTEEVMLSAWFLSKVLKGVIAITVNNKKLERDGSSKAYIVLKHGYQDDR